MAEIRPFRALRYNPDKVGHLGRVVTQPYDKITSGMQERYYALSPYNLARIIRGRQEASDTPRENVYTRAAHCLRSWIEQGAIRSDAQPAIYPYYQEYGLPGQPNVRKLRRGFIALGRIEDYSSRVIHRHEETLSGPKADRLELLKSTRAHFGQLFMLYSDPDGEIEKAVEKSAANLPGQDVTDEYGTRHALWRLSHPATIERITAAMRDKKLVIADGHHRYETALAYRDACRAQEQKDERAEYVMMTFIRKESEGLTILPTHRVVHNLSSFDWKAFLSAARQFFQCTVHSPARGEGWERRFLSSLEEAGCSGPSLAAFAGSDNLALLSLRPDADLDSTLADLPDGLRQLDAILLHRIVLERLLGVDRQAVREEKNLHYVRDAEEAIRQVAGEQAQVAFLMNPTPIASVWGNALAGNPLPQKSTDFFPKLLSGLTMYWLDNPAGI